MCSCGEGAEGGRAALLIPPTLPSLRAALSHTLTDAHTHTVPGLLWDGTAVATLTGRCTPVNSKEPLASLPAITERETHTQRDRHSEEASSDIVWCDYEPAQYL